MKDIQQFPAYTYYLYHIPTGKKYYGVRWANECNPENDLWIKYFGSSRLVDILIEEYGKESFIPEIRKLFYSREDALFWEREVIKRIKAIDRNDWLNQSNVGSYVPDNSGSFNPMYGQARTDEWKIAHSNFMIEWWTTERKEEQRIKVSGENNPMFGKNSETQIKAAIAWWTEERKRIQSEKMSGHNHPAYRENGQEYRDSISKKMSGENNPMYGTHRTGEDAPFFGHKHTKENKKEQSKLMKEYWASLSKEERRWDEDKKKRHSDMKKEYWNSIPPEERKWTKEQKEARSKLMKEYWRKRKLNQHNGEKNA